MNIREKKEHGKLTLFTSGRLDTASSPNLENALSEKLTEDVLELTLNFEELEYLSSAGLRILLEAHKRMKKRNGRMVIYGANKDILQVFKITGFQDFLIIEQRQPS